VSPWARRRGALLAGGLLVLGALPLVGAAPAPAAPAASATPGPTANAEAILAQARAAASDPSTLEAASQAIDAELKVHPRGARAHYVKGWILARRGQPEAALAALERAIRLDDRDADARFEAGRVLRRLGKPKEALRQFDAANRAAPLRIDCLAAAADLLADDGQAAAALTRWERAAAAAPGSFAVLEGLVRAHRAVGDHRSAATARDALIKAWRTSDAPAVKARASYVTERFRVGDGRVTAHEHLSHDGTFSTVYRFAVEDARGQQLGQVVLEASAAGRALGAGYAVTVVEPDGGRTSPGLVFGEVPDYGTLKLLITTVVRDHLLPKPPPAPAPATDPAPPAGR
jgi:Tfp pilus assembly protein PilF